MKNKKVILFVAIDWYFVSHRLSLALALYEAGYEVTVITCIEKHPELLEREDIKVLHLPIHRSGLNPLKELYIVIRLVLIYRHIKPDIVHHVALKPIVYGTFAARMCGIERIINAIAGFGSVFSYKQGTRVLERLINRLLKIALHWASSVIVQNREDCRIVSEQFHVSKDATHLVHGSGVDTSVFKYTKPVDDNPVVVSLVSRMLLYKGLAETIEAAKKCHEKKMPVRFILVGSPDIQNPTSVTEAQLKEWGALPNVEWLGYRTDIAAVWAQSHIALLPSYREGLPMSLIEAAACGRPIITTDEPGCRDMIDDGKNGIVIPSRNSGAIVAAIEMLVYDRALRERMGMESRKLAERKFALPLIINKQLDIYKNLLDVNAGII